MRSKNLENSNIRVQDITNAQTIFGPNCAGLKGKTVRKKPTPVEMEYVDILKDLFTISNCTGLKVCNRVIALREFGLHDKWFVIRRCTSVRVHRRITNHESCNPNERSAITRLQTFKPVQLLIVKLGMDMGDVTA